MNSQKNNTSKKRVNGQEMVEWWLIVTLMAFVVMFALLAWGGLMNTAMNDLTTTLNNVNTNVGAST